jgi:hypothetical protein
MALLQALPTRPAVPKPQLAAKTPFTAATRALSALDGPPVHTILTPPRQPGGALEAGAQRVRNGRWRAGVVQRRPTNTLVGWRLQFGRVVERGRWKTPPTAERSAHARWWRWMPQNPIDYPTAPLLGPPWKTLQPYTDEALRPLQARLRPRPARTAWRWARAWGRGCGRAAPGVGTCRPPLSDEVHGHN